MKTVTMRVDDSVYDMIKLAAEGQKRNLSNIMKDKKLVQNLINGLDDLHNGDYTIV